MTAPYAPFPALTRVDPDDTTVINGYSEPIEDIFQVRVPPATGTPALALSALARTAKLRAPFSPLSLPFSSRAAAFRAPTAHRLWQVRGASYLDDKVKVSGGTPLYRLAHVEGFRYPGTGIARQTVYGTRDRLVCYPTERLPCTVADSAHGIPVYFM
jgi:hypothetical protein